MPQLESVAVVLVHCNLVQKWLSTHIKSFVYFCPKQRIWAINKYFATFFNKMNTVNTEFSLGEVWFTDQGSKALEIEDNVNLALIIG